MYIISYKQGLKEIIGNLQTTISDAFIWICLILIRILLTYVQRRKAMACTKENLVHRPICVSPRIDMLTISTVRIFVHVIIDTYSHQNRVLWWRHYERDSVSNHRHLDFLLNRLFRRRSKKTSKLCVTGLCEGNTPVAGGLFLSERVSKRENVSIWWRQNAITWLENEIWWKSQFYDSLPGHSDITILIDAMAL